MTVYSENLLLCMSLPILILVPFLKKSARSFCIAFLLGMLACLFGAYINNYFKEYLGMSYTEAIRYITPIVEETIKLIPAILFVVIFLPKDSDILTFLAALGVGFATFENACYIIENGTDSIIFVLIRGASAGTMHVVSGLIGGVGLAFAKRFKPVMIVGTITVLTVSVTFHGMYNLLVSARGVLMYIGFAMPLAVAAVLAPIVKSNKLKSFSE